MITNKMQTVIDSQTQQIRFILSDLQLLKLRRKALDRAVTFLSENRGKWSKYELDDYYVHYYINKSRLELNHKRELLLARLQYHKGIRKSYCLWVHQHRSKEQR